LTLHLDEVSIILLQKISKELKEGLSLDFHPTRGLFDALVDHDFQMLGTFEGIVMQ
jgi:hypothetical protein